MENHLRSKQAARLLQDREAALGKAILNNSQSIERSAAVMAQTRMEIIKVWLAGRGED